MNNKIGQYDATLDILRALAILAVVGIHSTTMTIQAANFKLEDFAFSLYINQALRFAVPMFLIISGFLLEMNASQASYVNYLKKRAAKILIPYIYWSGIYYYFIYTNHSQGFAEALITGEASYQLYFIPSLFIFYLIFPILHKYKNILLNTKILMFVSGIQIYFLAVDYYIKPINLPHPLNYLLLMFGFFLNGMYFRENINWIRERFYKISKLTPLLLIFLSYVIYMEGKYKYFQTSNYLSFYSQWRPSVFIYSLLITIYLYFIFDSSVINKFIKKLSDYSFIIYFEHIIILEFVWKLFGWKLFNELKNGSIGRIIFDPIIFITIGILCFLSAYLLRKLPLSQKLLG